MSNIGQIAGAVVGATIGFLTGGLSYLFTGAAYGLLVGSWIFPTKLPNQYAPRLDDLKVTTSTYGKVIPIIYGTFRVSGNVIWATPLEEVATTTKKGGKGGGGVKVTEYTYFSTFALALSMREITGIRRIWANKKIIYDANSPDNAKDGVHPWDGMTLYTGTQTQMPDPTIQAVEGVANTPAYRGVAYIVFDRLALADFGNSLPNIEVEVIADNYITSGEVVYDICQRAGVEVHGHIWQKDRVRGYAIGRQTSAANSIIPLALAYDFDMVEEYHNIYVVDRPKHLSCTVPKDDLAAHEPSGQIPDLMPLVRAVENSIPTQANVTYSDPANDYQNTTQGVRREQVRGDLIRDVEVAIHLTAKEARQIATRILWGEASERISATITLGERYRFLRCGEVIALPIARGGHFPFRITQITKGQNATTQYEVVVDDSAAYINGMDAQPPAPTGNEFRISNVTDWMVLDTVLLRSFDSPTGFYWGLASMGRWRGAMFERGTGGGDFETVTGASVQTAIGECLTALRDGSTTIWDEVNTLDIELFTDSVTVDPESEVNVLNGANAAWVGDLDGQNGEIIQWKNSELIAPRTYRLSGFLRGRLGTEHLTGTHSAGQIFVALNETGVLTSDYGLGDYDTSRLYRAMSLRADNSGVVPRLFTNTGERARPRSGVHVRGERDVSNNLSVSWVPRSRIPVTGLAELVPSGEDSERYEVDILNGGVVVRTFSLTAPEFDYLATEQTTDGLTAGSPVDMMIYQLSETRGRGHPAIATV